MFTASSFVGLCVSSAKGGNKGSTEGAFFTRELIELIVLADPSDLEPSDHRVRNFCSPDVAKLGQTQTSQVSLTAVCGSQVTGLCVMNNQRRSCEGEHRLRKLSDSSSGYRCVCVRVNSHQRVLCDEMCDDRKGVCR